MSKNVRVNLSELKRKRSTMTTGQWESTPHRPCHGKWHIVAPLVDVASLMKPDDADGIVATHEAADLLIEVAEATILCRQAEARWQQATDVLPGSSQIERLGARGHLDAARERLDAALARISL